MNDFIEKINRDMQSRIDQELMNILGMDLEISDRSGNDIISDLNDIICKMTTVIVCSKNDKEKLEKQELPQMTKIIPTKYLEDGTVYIIKDENAKRMALGMEVKVDLSEFPIGNLDLFTVETNNTIYEFEKESED